MTLLTCLLIAGSVVGGCGGSGGGGGSNSPPVASAGPDQTVLEQSTVTLAGSATDPDTASSLAYAWSQLDGQPVALIDASSARASFIAPDVQPGSPEVLGFRLTVTDNAGASDTDDVLITVQEPGSVVTISGVARYEFVPPNPACNGLNYVAIVERPIRRATVQVIDAGSNVVLGSDVSDDEGNFAISVAPDANVFLRVRAELKRGGTPGWDVEVRDNTADTTSPLKQRPVYALESGNFSSGAVDLTRNLTATTGWNGTTYASPRAAAPFSVLDAIYTAMQLVTDADPAAVFPPLDAYWSAMNRPSDGTGVFDDDIAAGDIGTSFYQSGIDSLFLLGMAGTDTEEFDDHVIVHEWGHYFEDKFSRSDSIGGSHGLGDELDMRVAFGEGWATALSGMALANPQYCDTLGTAQSSGFRIDIEGGSTSNPGWFNELSVLTLLYDLWDTDDDGADNDSIGFGPIFDAMTEVQSITPAFTSIFSFTDALKSQNPAITAFVDALRDEQNISGTGIYGLGESNDAGSDHSADAIPVYAVIEPDGTPLNICSNRQFDNAYDGNKLTEVRLLRMAVVQAGRYEFDVATDADTLAQLPDEDDPDSEIDRSDPDMAVYRNGVLRGLGGSGEADHENFTTAGTLEPGDYVIDLIEFRHADPDSDPDFPNRSCFDITILPAP